MKRCLPASSFAILIGIALIAAPQTGSAAVAVSNLSNAYSSTWDMGPGGGEQNVANSFTTGTSAGTGWSLDSVTMAIDVIAGPGSDFTLYLASDNAGSPGSQLVGFTTNQPAVDGDYTYAPQSTINLAASTTYWLVASHTVIGDIGWENTLDTGETGLAGWAIGDDAYAFDGSTWIPIIILESAPVLFEVNATAVPEPGSIALLTFGIVGMIGFRRRKI